MFIIWGSRYLTSVTNRGHFYCPQCNLSQLPYKLMSAREWFTLYFIPIFPIGSPQVYVECSECGGTFKEEVLDLAPPTEADVIVRELEEHLYCGMSLEEAERRLTDVGMNLLDAHDLVQSLAGKRVWSCVSCGEHYTRHVKHCPTCREKEAYPSRINRRQ